MKDVKKKDLEILLESIEKPKEIKAELEQYTTPASIAADILWTAYYNGDIENKIVIDLGCGTGIFAIGSALLKAKKVIAVDIDEKLVAIAKKEVEKIGINIDFYVMDVEEFNEKGDVVIMNPPFGAQYANRKSDRKFVMKAMEISKAFYSLHLKESVDFIKKMVEKNEWEILMEKEYKFPIKASLPFHEKRVAYYDVVMLYGKRK
ncbi:MAG TPA: methyltransferase domain-containing protein [Thermoplasmatales archaeon]|nr:methyltransferase domain-containing protein [Thermoplasmatales archaeon]